MNKTWQQTKYEKHSLISIVQQSNSYAQVLQKLGRAPKGGNYKTVKQYIEKWKIDTSHFLDGKPWNKGLRKPLNKYKVKTSTAFFKRNIKESRGNKCEQCGLSDWQNQKLALEIHHLDGKRDNNDLTNLKVLCPNCHSITDNYRNRKRK